MSAENHKQTFFRQGGWMVITTFLSGLFMLGVHAYAPILGEAEYGLFGVLLAMLNMMAIPSIALQTVFAQQTAAAISLEQKNKLTKTVQTLLAWGFYLWLAMAVIVLVFQKNILAGLTIHQPIALWIAIFLGLAQLWGPILLGLLQGQQNFLWMGWVVIINGVGRFVAVGIIVVLLGGKATGAMTGATIGIVISFLIAALQSRSVWLRSKPAIAFDWKAWLGDIVPLTLGLGASQFIFSVDVIFVRAVFGDHQTGFYVGSGMIGRGLVMFTAPLIVVMFPKIVHNISHGKKTNVLGYTVIATAVLCGLAAAGCTAFSLFMQHLAVSPEIVKGYLSPTLFKKVTANTEALSVMGRLIPWFVWCMLPLALANVLLNNLMARKQFRVVPYLLIVIAAYLLTLTLAGNSFVGVIQILGIFNLIFLAVIAAFTWGGKAKENLGTNSVGANLPREKPSASV
jgi:O-antigen/teichoic acid export membrane protein